MQKLTQNHEPEPDEPEEAKPQTPAAKAKGTAKAKAKGKKGKADDEHDEHDEPDEAQQTPKAKGKAKAKAKGKAAREKGNAKKTNDPPAAKATPKAKKTAVSDEPASDEPASKRRREGEKPNLGEPMGADKLHELLSEIKLVKAMKTCVPCRDQIRAVRKTEDNLGFVQIFNGSRVLGQVTDKMFGDSAEDAVASLVGGRRGGLRERRLSESQAALAQEAPRNWHSYGLVRAVPLSFF